MNAVNTSSPKAMLILMKEYIVGAVLTKVHMFALKMTSYRGCSIVALCANVHFINE